MAGYVVYGSSTILVVSFGKGVHGFTLEPSLGTFILSHPNMTFPVSYHYLFEINFRNRMSQRGGKIYSVNQGNFLSFSKGYQDYIRWCSEEVVSVFVIFS